VIIEFPVYNKIPNCPDKLAYKFKVNGVAVDDTEKWLGVDLASKQLNVAPENPSLVGALVLSIEVKPVGLGKAENVVFTLTINV